MASHKSKWCTVPRYMQYFEVPGRNRNLGGSFFKMFLSEMCTFYSTGRIVKLFVLIHAQKIRERHFPLIIHLYLTMRICPSCIPSLMYEEVVCSMPQVWIVKKSNILQIIRYYPHLYFAVIHGVTGNQMNKYSFLRTLAII